MLHPAGDGLLSAVDSLLGRAAQITELARLLEHRRLVTLTGAPGIGKTRLALGVAQELAERHAQHATLVELAPVGDAGLVPGVLASALGLQQVPEPHVMDALIARLRERRTLIVLDNCEHLVDACAGLVDILLRGCPQLRVLATSREPLAIAGEHVRRVLPLSIPDEQEAADPHVAIRHSAIELFVARAQAVQSGFVLDAGTAVAVAELCRRLDGLPLAIELAAARADLLTPSELAERLDKRLELLTGGSRNAEPRHRTLVAALDWSHGLLSPREQALLRRLSVFVDGFSLSTAEAVCFGGAVGAREVLDVLAGLTAKSLVVADTATRGCSRYRLLETIRAYAGDRLQEAGETATLREAHARFFTELAEEAEPDLTGPRQGDWYARLDPERGNVRSAIEWSLGHGRVDWALRLAGGLVLYWRVRSFREGQALLEAVLAADGQAEPALRAKALWGAGLLALLAGETSRALVAIDESLSRFRELGDVQGCARATFILACCNAVLGGGRSVLPVLDESMALALQANDLWCLSNALGTSGYRHVTFGRLPEARPFFERCVAVSRRADNRHGLYFGTNGLGQVALGRGEYGRAETILNTALAIARDLGDDYGTAISLHSLGELALRRGDHETARARLEHSLALMRRGAPEGIVLGPLTCLARVEHCAGDRQAAGALLEDAAAISGSRPSIPALLWAGELAVDDGDPAAGRRLLEQALDVARRCRAASSAAAAQHALGRLERASGDLERAAALHHEAIEMQRDNGDAAGIVASLEAVAGLAAQAGRHAHAARLLGAADALRVARGYARLPWERVSYDEDVALIRASAPAADVEAAWAQGAALSIEEAVAQATKRRGSRRRPASGWASLTDAERQVATLAAQGLTNREIAERVFVTVATVKTHLVHSFSKLGISRCRELERHLLHDREPSQNR